MYSILVKQVMRIKNLVVNLELIIIHDVGS